MDILDDFMYARRCRFVNLEFPSLSRSHFFFAECLQPLGMENKYIPDSQITASSEWNRNHGPSNGRLNFQAGRGRTGAWSAKTNDVNQWLQVDLGQKIRMTGIRTQGRSDFDQWVTSFTVSYSNDGVNFTPYNPNTVWNDCVTVLTSFAKITTKFYTLVFTHCTYPDPGK